MVKQYELVVLLPASLSQDEVKTFTKALEKQVKTRKGELLEDIPWGKKQLAYELKKQREAIFNLYTISLDTSMAQAFERDVRLMDNVLRSLFVIKDSPKQRKTNPATIEKEQVQGEEK